MGGGCSYVATVRVVAGLAGGLLDDNVVVSGKVSLRHERAAATRPIYGLFGAHPGLGRPSTVHYCRGRLGSGWEGREGATTGGVGVGKRRSRGGGRWGQRAVWGNGAAEVLVGRRGEEEKERWQRQGRELLSYFEALSSVSPLPSAS